MYNTNIESLIFEAKYLRLKKISQGLSSYEVNLYDKLKKEIKFYRGIFQKELDSLKEKSQDVNLDYIAKKRYDRNKKYLVLCDSYLCDTHK